MGFEGVSGHCEIKPVFSRFYIVKYRPRISGVFELWWIFGGLVAQREFRHPKYQWPIRKAPQISPDGPTFDWALIKPKPGSTGGYYAPQVHVSGLFVGVSRYYGAVKLYPKMRKMPLIPTTSIRIVF